MAAGEEWYNALSGAGNDIANAMIMYHREHQSYDEAYKQAEALSRIGIDKTGRPVLIQMDEKGKPLDKDLVPAVDPKALDLYKTGNRQEWAKSRGALEVLSRLGVSYINRASEQNIQPQYQVTTPSGRTVAASAGQAIASDAEAQRRQDQIASGQVKAQHYETAQQRLDRGEKRQDIQTGLAINAGQRAAESAQRSELEKRPEIQFSRKYGLTPQAMIGLQESPYAAKDLQGNVIDENVPTVGAGERLKDLTSKPGRWNDFKSYWNFGDKGKRDTIVFSPKDPSGVFRESLYKYSPGKAPDGRQLPAREQHVVNPAGELLNVRGTRIPIDEVSAVQNAATAAQKDLQNTLASPTFQAFKREVKAAKLLQFKDRLSRLGYNPNDPFWGLPQQ